MLYRNVIYLTKTFCLHRGVPASAYAEAGVLFPAASLLDFSQWFGGLPTSMLVARNMVNLTIPLTCQIYFPKYLPTYSCKVQQSQPAVSAVESSSFLHTAWTWLDLKFLDWSLWISNGSPNILFNVVHPIIKYIGAEEIYEITDIIKYLSLQETP